jgi:hypothetical protein
VNEYLHEIAGEAFTAKDFRTWAGTVMAAMALQAQETFENKSQAKKNVKDRSPRSRRCSEIRLPSAGSVTFTLRCWKVISTAT